MARTLGIALVALVVAAAASAALAAPLLQDALDAGWESRWTHSSDAKYTGRFKSADEGGVQVSGFVSGSGGGGREARESEKSIRSIDPREERELFLCLSPARGKARRGGFLVLFLRGIDDRNRDLAELMGEEGAERAEE